MTTFEPGTVIADKYEVTRVLGQGGMGIVLAATHRVLREHVAVKILLPALRDRPEVVARFEREARAGARIKSAHVARVSDVGKTEAGDSFMVMEFLDGHDFGAVLHERGRLPVDTAVDYILQACEAVHEAHTLGIIHRDIKPGNLFLARSQDGFEVVKVLDFGISTSADADNPSMTKANAVMGTGRYMSPEQLSGAAHADARSDVWSLGVVLYEMLTGTTPFEGETFPLVAAAILQGPYAKASVHRPEIDPGLDAAIDAALARRVDDRLASVRELASCLVPFGTDAARASLASMDRVTARATGAAMAAAPGPAANPTLPGSPNTSTGLEGNVPTLLPVTGPRPWRRTAALGGVALLAAGTLGWRLVHHDVAPSAVTASESPPSVVAVPSAEPAPPSSAVPSSPPPAVACATPTADEAPPVAGQRAPSIVSAGPAPSAKATSHCARGNLADCQAACDRNDFAACSELGRRYAIATDGTKDSAKAVVLYQRACEGGNANGCLNLGTMNWDGDGTERNDALAVRYFLQACQGGEATGCVYLSIAYEQQRGVPKDVAESYRYATLACSRGATQGCLRVGMAKITGQGVGKDIAAGLADLEALCTHRQAMGCSQLAAIYAGRQQPDVAADPVRRDDYLKKACDLGDKRSCDFAAQMRHNAHAEGQNGQANADYEAKCTAGQMLPCTLLAENLANGTGGNSDKARAKALFEKACNAGVQRACDDLKGAN